MLTIREDQQIYFYRHAIDMRKSINCIVHHLLETLDQNPQTGDIFIFLNKGRDKMKLLFWDRNGFVLYYKRMAKGKFKLSKEIVDEKLAINSKQLQALLMGLDFYQLGAYPLEVYEDFF